MIWFKHYSNAHKGKVLQSLYEEFGVNEGYGLYFRFVEYFADKWDGCGEPRFTVLESELRGYLKLRAQKLRRFLLLNTYQSDFSFVESGKKLEIFFPKLLEIRHRDAIRAGIEPALSQHSAGIRREEKREESSRAQADWLYQNADELRKAISIADQSFFAKEYPLPEWVDRQIELCFRHHSAEDSTRPRTKGQWMKKLQTWLELGWQKRVAEEKKIVGARVVPITGGWRD